MTAKKSLIIVNPVSGTSNKKLLVSRIESYLKTKNISFELVYTQSSGHAAALVEKAAIEGFNHFVVVGGDGTINEAASAIIKHENVTMGILPSGSGNGLARHLKLPRSIEKALEVAFGSAVVKTDVGLLNGKPFFSVAGIGFDAWVAQRFAQMKGRGLRNYVRAVLKSYPAYKAQNYSIKLNGQSISVDALMVTFANSNQFGNNTSLAPNASLTDGLIDVCIMKKPPILPAVVVAPMLFLKKMHKTRYLSIVQTPIAQIELKSPYYFHLDGDAFICHENTARLEILPQALSIHIKS